VLDGLAGPDGRLTCRAASHCEHRRRRARRQAHARRVIHGTVVAVRGVDAVEVEPADELPKWLHSSDRVASASEPSARVGYQLRRRIWSSTMPGR
jgi:hypothetical protein